MSESALTGPLNVLDFVYFQVVLRELPAGRSDRVRQPPAEFDTPHPSLRALCMSRPTPLSIEDRGLSQGTGSAASEAEICGHVSNCLRSFTLSSIRVGILGHQYTYSDTVQITYLLVMCNNRYMVAETRRIRRKLLGDGWYLPRHGANQNIYRHPTIAGIITLPRHRYVSKSAAASIARKAKWHELENYDGEQVSSAD